MLVFKIIGSPSTSSGTIFIVFPQPQTYCRNLAYVVKGALLATLDAMTKSRVFLFILMSFIGGIAFGSFIDVPIGIIWILALFPIVGISIGAAKRNFLWIIACVLFFAFLAGIFRFAYAEKDRPDLSPLYGEKVAARGVVWEEPRQTDKAEQIKIKITEIDGGFSKLPFFTLTTVRRYPRYRVGDEVTVRGTLEKPENYSNFDYVSYLARENIFSILSFPEIEKIGEGKRNALTVYLLKTKRAFEGHIDVVLPEPHSAFLKGILLGDRASLPKELVDDFKKTGTSHIIALSGYNITVVGRFFMTTLLFLTVSFYASFWIASAAIIFFVLLAGASASLLRAAIMGILVLVAEREGRPYSIRNALAFAGAAMVFQNPYLLRFDAGFELSFLATLGLIYLSPRVEKFFERMRSRLRAKIKTQNAEDEEEISLDWHMRRSSGFVSWLTHTLAETISAQIAVLPLLIYLFGSVSVISPITNVLVLAAVPYTMAVGFITGALGFIAPISSEPSGWVVWILLHYMLWVIEFFAKFPYASWAFPAWVIIPLLIMYGVVGWNVWKKSKKT